MKGIKIIFMPIEKILGMEKHDYKNLWMSPNVAIVRLSSLINKYGPQKVLKKSIFKHEREAWITALFFLGLKEISGKEYWIEIETRESTPDTYGYYLENINGNYHRRIFNIEITEWEEHSGGIMEIIKNKSNKFYPDFYFLLIYARKNGEIIDYDEIHNKIIELKVPFFEIWVLANSSANNDYHLTEIYRQKFQIRFNLDSALSKNINQISFATFLKRGAGTKLTDLGTVYVPTPECDD